MVESSYIQKPRDSLSNVPNHWCLGNRNKTETSVQEGRRLGEKKLNYWLDQDEEMPFSSKNAPHRYAR